jgi:hypothetical protein
LRVCFISFSCLNSRGGLFQSLRFPAQAAADARAGDVVLLNHPADTTGPRCNNCYLVEVQDFAAAAPGGEGKKFKIDPQRLLDSLQWLHTATPPDFNLQLVRDPALWFDMISLTLLAELSRRDPQLRDRLRAATAP